MTMLKAKPAGQARVGDVVLLSNRCWPAVITSLASGASNVVVVGYADLYNWETGWDCAAPKSSLLNKHSLAFAGINLQVETPVEDLMTGNVIVYDKGAGKGVSSGLIQSIKILDKHEHYHSKISFVDGGEELFLWLNGTINTLRRGVGLPDSFKRVEALREGDCINTGGCTPQFRTIERIEIPPQSRLIRLYYCNPSGMQGIRPSSFVEVAPRVVKPEPPGHLHVEMWL